MVKRAKSEVDIKRVKAYLESKKLPPLTNNLYYVEDENGMIIGCFGIETKLCIEPLQSDSIVATKSMFDYALGLCSEAGKVHIFTDSDKVIEGVKKYCKPIEWGKDLTELIILT